MAFTISDTLGNVDTAGAATAVASSIAGTTVSATATASPSLIDVSNGSTQFTGGSTLSFNAGTFTIADLAGVANGAQASNAATAWAVGTNDAAVTNTTITVTGDFSASLGVDTNEDGNTSQGEGVTLTGGITQNATTLTADTATFVVSGADTATAANSATTVNVNVDGTTVIPEQAIGLTVAIDYTTAGLTDESLTASLASIAKDGSTATAPLLLNPDGAYDNFIRVSNTGTVEGAVFATITNDSGTSVTFTLIDSLGAGASSDLISVDDLYTSAQAADATFDVGTGKLRGSFTGEFAGINVQNISTSTDGTTFFTF